jgi:hypothetical protein
MTFPRPRHCQKLHVPGQLDGIAPFWKGLDVIGPDEVEQRDLGVSLPVCTHGINSVRNTPTPQFRIIHFTRIPSRKGQANPPKPVPASTGNLRYLERGACGRNEKEAIQASLLKGRLCHTEMSGVNRVKSASKKTYATWTHERSGRFRMRLQMRFEFAFDPWKHQ